MNGGAERRWGPPARRAPDWWKIVSVLTLFLLAPVSIYAQAERPLIDVESYDIDVEIDFETQVLEARTEVTFLPREETHLVVFELHNGLNLSRVEAADGSEVPAVRYRQDFTIRLNFYDTLPVGEPVRVTFFYDGRLQGTEDSPVEGVSLASIEPDRALLLYPGRWFPVNGYGADRFASTISVTTAGGYHVVASGLPTRDFAEDGREKQKFTFDRPSFPGSVAVLPDEPLRVDGRSGSIDVYFHSVDEELRMAYGDAAGSFVEFFTDKFGAPYTTSLAVVEMGESAPTGYSAPGIIFLSPFGIGQEVNRQLLGTQVAHQWWRAMVSPGNRNHTWLDLGLASYSSALQVEEEEGEEAFDATMQDIRINALTYDEIPIIQSGRLPDFSLEISALAGAKGALVAHMLRWMLGDEAFQSTLRQFIEKFAWRSATTDDFLETAEAVSGENLGPFFIQWTESRGTPEFNQEYTIYRLGGGKGFRVLGKVKQDMDTFRMPVELKIETEGEPEFEVIEVVGVSSDYTIDTFGKPKRVILDPKNRILRFDNEIRVRVAIRKGEQLVEYGYYNDALIEYQKALQINRYSSLAHYRIGEVFFLQNNYQSAANEFRESLNGDQEPAWTQVWSHVNLGKIFDITGQRERAVNEYQLAVRIRDDTQGAQAEAGKYLEKPYRRPRRTERVY